MMIVQMMMKQMTVQCSHTDDDQWMIQKIIARDVPEDDKKNIEER